MASAVLRLLPERLPTKVGGLKDRR